MSKRNGTDLILNLAFRSRFREMHAVLREASHGDFFLGEQLVDSEYCWLTSATASNSEINAVHGKHSMND